MIIIYIVKFHASKIIAHKKLYIHSTWIVPANPDGMGVERSFEIEPMETEQQSILQPAPENPVTANKAAPLHLDVQGNSLGSTHEQPNTQILSSLGKRVTNTQAKRLNELGLSFEALKDLRSSSKHSEEFGKALLDSGVRSKPLHGKLCDIVKPKH